MLGKTKDGWYYCGEDVEYVANFGDSNTLISKDKKLAKDIPEQFFNRKIPFCYETRDGEKPLDQQYVCIFLPEENKPNSLQSCPKCLQRESREKELMNSIEEQRLVIKKLKKQINERDIPYTFDGDRIPMNW